MLKRKSDGGGDESSGKKAQGAEVTQQPIPRHLPTKHVTLNFYQKTWEEIAPGRMYYLPLCQNPKYMFDPAMRNQMGKFRELWGTMEIHKPKYRLSRLTMLQDDLRVQNNTPTDATAFTQVLYLMKFCPKGMKQYFKLGTLMKEDMSEINDITYELKPNMAPTNPRQMVELKNFQDFESLTIQGAKANFTAGFVSGQMPNIDKNNNYKIMDPYIAPNAASLLSVFSGNLNPEAEHFIPPALSTTMARNLNGLSFFQYGDELESHIVTNLEGTHLVNTLSNDFLNDQSVLVEDEDKKITYSSEFCWPSRNRPFICRKNYFDPATDPIIHGKQLGSLEHHFFCMPPIRKPNEALLGQRCAVILEQSMAVTFHMNQGTYFDNEEDDALQMDQDNSVVIRRNVYGKPVVVKSEPSIYCPNYTQCFSDVYKNRLPLKAPLPVKQCYDDSFTGFAMFCRDYPLLVRELNTDKYKRSFRIPQLPESAIDCDYFEFTKYLLSLKHMDDAEHFPGLKIQWHRMMEKEKGVIRLWWSPAKGKQPPIDEDNHYVYMAIGDNLDEWIIRNGADVAFQNYVEFSFGQFLKDHFFPNTLNSCNVTNADVPNKECLAFFT